MKEQKSLTPKIKQAINYYTNRLSRSFRLQFADKEDVRQELTLKGLEAIQSHTSDMTANVETYAIRAIRHRAIDLAGEFIASSQFTDIDIEADLLCIEPNLDLRIDVQEIIEILSERQKIICAMLMAGYTQEEIATEIGIKQQSVQEQIVKLRKHFVFLKI